MSLYYLGFLLFNFSLIKIILRKEITMKKYSLSVFAGFTIIFLFQACYFTPRPVYKAKPVSKNTVWLYGKEFLEMQTENLDITIAFEGPSVHELVFDVEIINRAPKSVIVEPGFFYYDPVSLLDEKINMKNRIYAKNPEAELIKIAKFKTRENAAYATQKGNEAIISLFALVGDIASIGKDKTEEELIEEEEFDYLREEVSINNDIEHEEEIYNLNNETAIWETSALRKTIALFVPTIALRSTST